MTGASPDPPSLRKRLERVEQLLSGLEELPDPQAQARAGEAVEALVDLYGDALARIMVAVAASSDESLAGALADDDLVCHLLLVHDLHPLTTEERIGRSLQSLGSSLGSGTVSLVAFDAGVATIRLVGGDGAGGGCGSVPAEQLVEAAVWDAAPELAGVKVEHRPAPVPVQLRPAPPPRIPSASAPGTP